MKWPVKKIQEVASIHTGKTPSTSDASNFEGDIPFATPSDLNGVIVVTNRHVSLNGSKSLTLVRAGASLVGCIGDVGKIGFATVPMTFNQQINAVVWNQKLVDDKYGFFVLRFLSNVIKQKAVSAVVPILNKTNFSKIEIPLPPIAEQQRIAALLDTADRILKLRESAIEKLDQLAQSVFVDMFGDPKSTTRWDRKEIAKLGKVYTGKTPSTSDQSNFDGDVPFVTPTDLRGVIKDSTRKISLKGAETITVVRGGSSLVGCIGDVGRVGYVTTPVTFNQQINAVVWNNELVLDVYGFYVLQYMASVFKNKSVSAVVPILNKTNFSSVNIPVPSINEQIKFVNFINSLWSLKEKMISERESELVLSLQHQSFAVN